MNDLLNLAIKAHGGLERWRQVRSLQARVTLNGTLWRIKGRPNGLPGELMRAETFPPTPLTRHFIAMTRAFFRGMTTPRTCQAAWPLTIFLTFAHSTTTLAQLSAAWANAEPTAPL